VRNKMRLLGLPKVILDDLRAGFISEGIGRALLPMYDIPEFLRLEAEDRDELKPSEIIEAARSGIAPEKVIMMVTRLANRLVPLGPQVEQMALPIAESGSPEDTSPLPYPTPLSPPGVTGAREAEAAVEGGEAEEVNELEGEDNEDNQEELETQSQNVSMETVEEPEPEPAPVPQTPRPQPIPQPIRPVFQPIAVSKPASQPARISVPTPVQAPAPVPTPDPPAIVPWEKSTILLSMTLWPEDGMPGGRMVIMGARANQGIPLMAQARMDDLVLPGPLQEMVSKLHQKALDEIQPVQVEG